MSSRKLSQKRDNFLHHLILKISKLRKNFILLTEKNILTTDRLEFNDL
jgi:hypothetical protein